MNVPQISARDESSCVLEALAIMRRCGVSAVESEELQKLAREMKLGTTPYHLSFLSMAQSIETGGTPQKDKLLEISLARSGELDATLQLWAWIRETFEPLLKQVERGRDEGDAKREFRERLQDYLFKMYPGATLPTIVLTIGQCFEDTPGVWTFNVGRCVLALRNLKRL